MRSRTHVYGVLLHRASLKPSCDWSAVKLQIASLIQITQCILVRQSKASAGNNANSTN